MTLSVKLTTGLLGLAAATSVSSWGGYALTRSVKDQINKEKINLLDLTDANESNKDNYADKDKWEAILKKDSSMENTEAKAFAKWDTKESEDYQKINKLKEQCRNKLKILYLNRDYWTAIEEVKKFCTKEKDSEKL